LSKVFLEYDQAALDAQYDQLVWAPDRDAILARCAAASDAVRARLGEPATHAYGPDPAERLDVYGTSGRALIFVHGGAWRRSLRRESAFPAEAVVRAGARYVALGFAVLPAATLAGMAAQVGRAIAWVAKNISPDVALCAHSSGAHLSACALTQADVVRNALLVSGLYDLAPVRLSARNEFTRLDERLEGELSPIRHADRIRCPVTVAWAEKESAEFARQSSAFAARLRAPALVGEGLNHFGIAEKLADAASPVGRALLALLE
jgi:arylformamidase